jgi:RNA polymerase sigma factor (sigma-70 family)
MFLTLNEYLIGAQKILNMYGYSCHKRDDDAISYVASCMMKADQTWDGHSSSRDTWRFNQARYAIMKLKTKTRKQRKHISLNKSIGKSGDKDIQLSDVIEVKSQIDYTEDFNRLIEMAKKVLSEKQLSCLLMYYKEGLTLQAIGDKLGVTKEAIRLNLQRSIGILRNECKT